MTYIFTSVTQASSRQRQRLREEILKENFIDRSSLDLILRDIGKTTLEKVSSEANLRIQFEAALDWLNDGKLIGKFCTAVVKEWPDRNIFLSELFDKILSETATMLGGPLRDRLYLFDRVSQEAIFETAICQVPEHAPAPPVVVMISGVREDEVDLMLDRIVKKTILDCYTTPPQKSSSYVLEMTQDMSASNLFQKLARWVLGGRVSSRESVEELLPKVRARIAGQMFHMRLRSDAVTAQTEKIFAEFFGYWSRLGSHPLPPFLFLLVEHEETQPSTAPVSPADWYDMIRQAGAPCGPLVMIVDHLVLTECQSHDIRNWIDTLGAEEADPDFAELVKRARTVFDQSSLVKMQRPFRLQQIKTVLDEKL